MNISANQIQTNQINKNVSSENMEFTEELKHLLHLLENTGENIFITGKAGTGKSTLLDYLRKNSRKKAVFIAPTGVAAMNIRGETIHSMFKFPPKLIQKKNIKPDFIREKLFKKIDMIVIDEISMVRADILDGIDYSLRMNRAKPAEPFGGVQMVFVGDLFQLPPIVQDDLRDHFTNYYSGEHFFNAKVFNDGFKMETISLTKIFRQSDEQFISLLNKIRTGEVVNDDMVLLNSRCARNENSAIILATRNNIVKRINDENLARLTTKEYVYQAELKGNLAQYKNSPEYVAEYRFPADIDLKLKVGAQVMMIKNDASKRWVNGSIGKITKLSETEIFVDIEGLEHKIEKESWAQIEYNVDGGSAEIVEKEKGKFVQFPIRLAWAITIHKSQGKTFDKVHIDIGSGAFAAGQTYVALSRAKSLQGITLSRPLRNYDVIVDDRVKEFFQNNG
jgi:ATP-dependent exoDNAse (exonuclease V) alpha subunit